MKTKPVTRHITRLAVALVVVSLSFLWLSELTRRKAREEADYFLGPLLEQERYEGQSFSWLGISGDEGKLSGPGWITYYQPKDAMNISSLGVQCSLVGPAKATTALVLRPLIGLPFEQRMTKMKELTEKQ